MENLLFHPAVVHLPIGIAILLPFITLLFIVLRWKGRMDNKCFSFIIILHFLLSISAYAAMATGDKQEHRVEKVVEKKHIKEHEERAESFFIFSIILLATSFALYFTAQKNYFISATSALLLLQFILLFLGYRVGEAGGDLVYKYGAANAYLSPTQNIGTGTMPPSENLGNGDHDDD